MRNLFSSFDPNVRFFSVKFSLNWISLLFPLILIPQIYWITGSNYSILFVNIQSTITKEFNTIVGKYETPSIRFGLIAIFVFLLISNLLGLVPYVFTPSRHIVIRLCVSLPLWIGSILISLIYQYNNLFSHIVPTGTPPLLIPLIVLIERVSSIIRPFTLAVRLSANIIAGHLLITLISTTTMMSRGNSIMCFLCFTVLLLLIVLEIAVACIQSYVFTILRTLYLNEHHRILLVKKFLS